jgi:hypothetical protein
MYAASVSRMALFERRSLSVGEVALASIVFGDTLDYRDIRIVQAPRATFGATAPFGATIYFANWRAAYDFALCDVAEQGWLVHEIAHIWQARRGIFLPWAKLAALGRSAYRYTLTPGKPFAAYNIEQQAEIARHVFHARIGQPAKGAPPAQALEYIWPIARARHIA